MATDEIDKRVTVEMMQEELHIDGEESILQDLIENGEEYVAGSIDFNIPLKEYYSHSLFRRAVKTYVTGYYYDRTSGIGSNKSLLALINQLKGRIWR